MTFFYDAELKTGDSAVTRACKGRSVMLVHQNEKDAAIRQMDLASPSACGEQRVAMLPAQKIEVCLVLSTVSLRDR